MIPTAAVSSAPADLGRTVLAEWTKFRTVRSSFWTLLISIALTVGIGTAFLPVRADMYDGPPAQATDTAIHQGWWYEGLHVSILAVMILGVLAAASEYSTGTIRATLAAVPFRTRVLAAKALAVTAITLVAGAAQAAMAFLAARPILADRGIDVPLTDPVALRGVVMAALAVAGAGLFGLGAGLLIRHTAGAIGAVTAVTWVVSALAHLLPLGWADAAKMFPADAMAAMYTPHTGTLTAGPATAVFFGYLAILLTVAGVSFTRRDA